MFPCSPACRAGRSDTAPAPLIVDGRVRRVPRGQTPTMPDRSTRAPGHLTTVHCKHLTADYNLRMAKKITLEGKVDALTSIVEKGLAAVADDIGALRRDTATKVDLEKLATKEQLAALHSQVNSIERQLRGTKTEIRLADLEEKVFGKVRS